MTAFSAYSILGLSRNPFPPTPDSESYFFTAQLEEDFNEISHCIEARKGFCLLTGEVGLGKTTMVQRLLDTLHDKPYCTALVLNTFLQDAELLSAIQADFGLPACDSLAQGLDQLNRFLVERHQADETCLLVIDDAQNLTVKSLELVRLLCNLETRQEKLLQILLVGQPELEEVLARPELRQLKSRIVKHVRLHGLERSVLGRYFDCRVNYAGAAGRLSIDDAAVNELHRATQGNLRKIHLVLDRCLYGLAGLHQSVITPQLVRRALKDLPTLGEGNSSSRHTWRKPWITAGAGVLGGVLVIAAAGYGGYGFWSKIASRLDSLPSMVAAPVSSLNKPNLSTTTASDVVAIAQAAAPESPVRAVPKEEITPGGMEASPASPFSYSMTISSRAICEKKLQLVMAVDESVQVQRLPSVGSTNSTLKPSERICYFTEDGVAWVAWLSRSNSSQIALAQQITRNIQTNLKARGLMPLESSIDGLFGPRTQEAFSRFQQEQGLEPTGKPDDLTLFLLEQQHATSH